MSAPAGRIVIVFPGDAGPGRPAAPSPRLDPVFTALAGLGLIAEPVAYSAAGAGQVRGRLLAADAVLAWVDPVGPDGDRAVLDAVLRDAAAAGTWIGSYPDVIAKMGTKEVLYATRGLGWGTDTHRYATPAEFRRQFPARLAADGIRVLKPSRGNGGLGVWKVTSATAAAAAPSLDRKPRSPPSTPGSGTRPARPCRSGS
jgi:hypothetical protein